LDSFADEFDYIKTPYPEPKNSFNTFSNSSFDIGSMMHIINRSCSSPPIESTSFKSDYIKPPHKQSFTKKWQNFKEPTPGNWHGEEDCTMEEVD
jgi:hypothetical protein